MSKCLRYSNVTHIRNPFFVFSLLFYPLFSEKLCVSVSYEVVSHMRDSTVQITWLLAMVTKISVATITGNYCFSQKVSSVQNWSFYASKQPRYQ